MPNKLRNKVAVITGGSSGIGLATAKLFARQGAKVAITGRTVATLDAAVAEIGHAAFGTVSDVSTVSSFQPLYAQVERTYGKIDVLVVNAGVMVTGPLADFTEAMFDQVSNTNYKGAFFTVQQALPFLNDGASIILTSSTVATKGLVGGAAYSSSKAAERSLVRSFAAELAIRHIRVNTLSPGSIDTPIFANAGIPAARAAELTDFLIKSTALKRIGTADEMARGFLFLASDDSSYMTGGDLVLDGGLRDL